MSGRAILPALLLCIFALQAGSAIPLHSVTIDEYAHVPAGYSYWRTGVFTIYSQNPPLVKLWFTLPFLFTQPDLGFTLTSCEGNPWECGRLFLMKNYSGYRSLFIQARTMVLLLGVVLGILLCVWAKELYGFTGALLALFLYAFCPNMLAHSQLATPDVGFCLTTLLALFTLWKFCRSPSWKTILLSGIVLGLVQLSKFTALLFYPMFLMIVILYCLLDKRPIKNYLLGLMVIFLLSLLVINTGYLFQGMYLPLKSLALRSRLLTALSQTFIGHCPLPLPNDFIRGFDIQMREAEGGQIAFLNGVFSTQGWWYYFLEAFALKTPLPFLLLLVLRCTISVRHARPHDTLFFALPILTFFLAFSFLTDIDIGLRYILPVYPLLFLWVSPLFGELMRRTPCRRQVVPLTSAILLFLYGLPTLWIFPHHLSYFNLIAGGPEGGYRYLIDSNIDWGQDIPQLKRLMEERRISRLYLAYFGVVAPEVYGISYDLPPLDRRPSGYLAVSVSILQGKGEWFPTLDGKWVFLPENALTWVRQYKPVARAGYSIYLYKLP